MAVELKQAVIGGIVVALNEMGDAAPFEFTLQTQGLDLVVDRGDLFEPFHEDLLDPVILMGFGGLSIGRPHRRFACLSTGPPDGN